MTQKTDTISKSKDKSASSTSSSSQIGKTKNPPSWSELINKMDAEATARDSVVLTASILAAGFLLPIPLGWITAIFVTTLGGSYLGVGDMKSGAISGGIVASITAFFGSILISILTLGLITVLPALVMGVIFGAIGGYVGKKLRE